MSALRDLCGLMNPQAPFPAFATVTELQQRAATAGIQTASLDEVLCITALSLNQAS